MGLLRRRRVGLWTVAVATAVGLALLWAGERESAPRAPSSEDTTAGKAHAAPSPSSPGRPERRGSKVRAAADPPDSPGEPQTDEPAVTKTGGTDSSADYLPGSYPPCPEQTPEPPPDRPSLGELVRVRTAELQDRARRALREGAASETLRSGLRMLGSREDGAVEELVRAPDRIEDGFDYATASAVVLASHALSEQELERARHLAEWIVGQDDRDPLGHVIVGLVARRKGEPQAARRALRRAFELRPDEPAVALALAQQLASGAYAAEAVRALDAYLKARPDDRAAGTLRARLAKRARIQRGYTSERRHAIRILWDPETWSRSQVREVRTLIDRALQDAARLTGTSRRTELAVVVYPSREELLDATCVQGWTGAAYDGSLRLAGELLRDERRRARILRHEALHAQLHPAVRDAPRWLDEGLAQYFADQRGPGARRSWRVMVENETWVPFASLEGSFQVIQGGRDAGLAYHQSLAMVDFMVDRGGTASIREAVAYLVRGGDPRRVWERIVPGEPGGKQLLRFLRERLEQTGGPAGP